jgi:transposase
MHFVGSLRPSAHEDLLKVPPRRFEVVDEAAFPGLSAYETRTDAVGAERRAVVTFSTELFEAQYRGLDQSLAKARRSLFALQKSLAGGRSRRSGAELEAEVAEITKARYLRRCIEGVLHGEVPGGIRLEVVESKIGRAALEREVFGKRVLFSDHEDWSIAQLVAAYRSQWLVESDFRQMKDRDVVSFSPMFHLTEQKIRVHVLYCVLALLVALLMVREASNAGMHLSVRAPLSSLSGIEETVLVYPSTGSRPRVRRVLTEMDDQQRRLFELFGLAAWAPTR